MLDVYEDLFPDVAQIWLFRIRFKISRFLLLGNIGILRNMAVDRTWAVFRPYTYQRLKTKLGLIAFWTITLAAIETVMSSVVYMKLASVSLTVIMLPSTCYILITYPLIACKLYQRKKSRKETISLGVMPVQATDVQRPGIDKSKQAR